MISIGLNVRLGSEALPITVLREFVGGSLLLVGHVYSTVECGLRTQVLTEVLETLTFCVILHG